MSQAVTLSAHETSERLIAVLRDCAEKLASLNEQAAEVFLKLAGMPSVASASIVNAVRLISLQEVLDPRVAGIAQHASGMLEQSDLDHVVWTELKLRLDEVEEHQRYSRLMAAMLSERIKDEQEAKMIRTLLAKAGRKPR